MNWEWTSIDSMSAISEDEYSSLGEPEQTTSPFLKYSFLRALEENQCVGGNTGWLVKHIVIKDLTGRLVAFLPAYKKYHSYGEYVFDQSWANAYQQHGLSYWPKLVIAVPFTPVSGSRVLLSSFCTLEQVSQYLSEIDEQLMSTLNVSSVHFLFTQKKLSQLLIQNNFHQRQSVQFNWHNNNYTSFNDFMASLTARRRRSIRKERSKILKQGVQLKRISGKNLTTADIRFFYTCYQQTYIKRSGHAGYLTEAFFLELLLTMPDSLLLVVAEKKDDELNDIANINGTPIASALFLFDENGLFGRYWGSHEDVSGLHFEVCYYQGIEFCIENKISLFNPGTQGEHKILRGFSPTICYSNHKMLEAAFDNAVADFLRQETPHIVKYAKNSASLLPYKENIETIL